MDKREYHRNYYYKRDPAKLARYRKKYNVKIKKRRYMVEYNRKRCIEKHGRLPVPKIVLTPEERREKRLENQRKYYHKHREERLEHMNFMYRARKLKEYADNVLNNTEPIK